MALEGSRDRLGGVRRMPALLLALVMVGSIGVVPVSAVVAVAGVAPLNWNNLARSVALEGLEPLVGADGFMRERVSLSHDFRGPTEVVVALQGNSLAAEQAQRIAEGRPALDAAGQKAYVASLRDAQASVKASLQSAGARILHEYRIVFNGFDVLADRAVLAQVLSLPGVSHWEPTQKATPALDKSVPFILGGESYSDLGSDGTGIRIGIIDTGIDYTHADFGGSGNPADYAANNATFIEPGTFPTAKVVAGTDLVGEWYDANCAPVPPAWGVCSSIPVPDPDPLDQAGHGSHVAGIAAGIGTSKVDHGVAPGASLLIFKVFALGSTSSANVVAAIEMATDPNGDGDTSDHVDVINMSLGSPYGRNTNADSVATNAAASLGVIVAASAGNSGNLPYNTGSPAVATNAISVAAGNDPGISLQLAAVAGSKNGTADGNYESLPAAFGPGLSATGTQSGVTTFAGAACNPITANLTGMIPLIARGTCTFVTKVRNAQNAGAIAAVVYNNVANADPITMGDDGTGANVTIPAVMVGNADGLKIRANIAAGNTTFTLDPANQVSIPNRLQGFTSRGPRFGDATLKPDVTAPGGSIFSALAGSGDDGINLSGTSMASPHVAGAAAILRALHPRWSVQEIKSALMNTATDAERGGIPYPVSLQGAGRVRVDLAAKAQSVVSPGSASFGVRESGTTAVQSYHMDLQVRNKGSGTKTFDVTSAFRTTSQADGSVAVVLPSSITVQKGRTATLSLDLRVDFRMIPAGFVERDGFVTLTERGGGDVLRVPFHIVPAVRSAAFAQPTHGGVTLRNPGLADTFVDFYQFGVSDPNENLIREAPDMPNDPDDWFDISATGAHVFDDPDLGRVLEFAVATHGLRSIANMMATDVWIDVDGDRIPDYVVEVADLGLVTVGDFDASGRMVSAVYELTSGDGFLEFVVGNPRNTAIQTAPVLLDDLNFLGALHGAPTIDEGNQTFRYFVSTLDLETGSFDSTRSAKFNAIHPSVDADPQFLLLPAGTATAVDTLGGGKQLLVVYYNNGAGRSQTQMLGVGHGD
jgi:minor extracellular serine protease Vpr